MAEVKAPRSWPKSSLSISSEGIAAQLTSTNGAVAFGVQPACDQLFAGAVFARDQHARFARRDLVDQQADMFDLGRGADDMLRLRIVPAAGAACRGRRGGGHGGRVVDRAVDGLQQAVHVDGFGQIVLGAVAYGLHGRVD